MSSTRTPRNGGEGTQCLLPSVKLIAIPLPEDELVQGELDLIFAHLAGLLERANLPDLNSDPEIVGEPPWP